MNRAATVLLAGLALVASATAIAATTNAGVALPAAAVAVAASALLLLVIVDRTRWPKGRVLPTLPADPANVRASFEARARGRSALVSLLDTLERQNATPDLIGASLEEVARIETLGPTEFREYLDGRVRELEKRT